MFENWSKKVIWQDIDNRIIELLKKELNKIRKERLINWKEFRKYCIEVGHTNPPNILTVPTPVLDRCIKQVRKGYKYD